MKFTVKFDDKEEGPIDQETIEKWIEVGNILPTTPLRNSLIPQWKKAGEFECFKENFERQLEILKKDGGSVLEEAKNILGIDKEEKKEKGTAFIYKYLPNPAPIHLRILAAAIDCAILAVIAIILFAYGTMSVLDYGKNTTPAADSNTVLDKQTEVIKKKETPKEDETAKATTEEGIEAKNRLEELNGTPDDILDEDITIPKKDKLNATRPPTRSDDTTRSYRRGSKWVDTSTSTTYTCLSGTP